MDTSRILNSPELFLSKAQGCLIGLAVGDAFGDIARTDSYRNQYGIVTNLYAGAKSTDDTEFAVLTAQVLLDCRGRLTPQAVLEGWRRYILAEDGMFERGGRPLYGAVANIRRGILPPLSGRYNVMNNDDGAAMRIAPVGILCAGDPLRAAQMAEIDAQISHYQDGIWAAQAVASGVAVAMADGSVDEVLAAVLANIPAESWLGYAMDKAMRICDQADCIEDAWEDLHIQFWTPAHSVSPEAIPQALAVYRLTGGDFRKGMFWGGNFGRDADTIGAVIGALCGARHGLGMVPPAWVEKVRHPSGVCLKFTARRDLLETSADLAYLALELKKEEVNS